jgi:hypothetical protein
MQGVGLPPGPFAYPWHAVTRRFIRHASIASAVLLGLLAPTTGLAHPGGEPFIHVPLSDVAPGSSFPVIVADLGLGAIVSFELMIEPEAVRLGETRGTPDGHFETTLQLPAATPDGYVQLRASIPDGTEATTWIHVVAGASAPPATGGEGFEFVPVLAGGLALGSLALLLVVTRRRPARPPIND